MGCPFVFIRFVRNKNERAALHGYSFEPYFFTCRLIASKVSSLI